MKPYKHFTLLDRECLWDLLNKGKNQTEIARIIDFSPSAVSREIRRNRDANGNYNPYKANDKYKDRRKNCRRISRIKPGTDLYIFIIECLKKYWPPEIIVVKWKESHPDEKLSHSTIYMGIKQCAFEGITAKKHLRRRGKIKYGRRAKFNAIQPDYTIHDRPEVIEKRARFGDWEGDTIRGGPGKGAIVTLVDRKGRYTTAMLLQDLRAATVTKAINKALQGLPVHSITFDNGSEFAGFREIQKELNIPVYFADPHAPWQRGTNENMNGLLRFFFPRGTNFLDVLDEELERVLSLINDRPRLCLGAKSPRELLFL